MICCLFGLIFIYSFKRHSYKNHLLDNRSILTIEYSNIKKDSLKCSNFYINKLLVGQKN